jgi:hypothetical protein
MISAPAPWESLATDAIKNRTRVVPNSLERDGILRERASSAPKAEKGTSKIEAIFVAQ